MHETGRREVIGLQVGEVESEAEWRAFLRELVARGLSGVQLVISDAHQGLKNAIGQVLGAQWQRCAVHFVRDMLGHVPRTNQPLVRGALKQVFAAPDRQHRRRDAGRRRRPARAAPPARSRGCWRPPRRSCWPTCASPASTGPRSARTNPLERVNLEIARRSDVVGIYPNDAALLRLATSLLVEQNDEWLVQKRYLSLHSLAALNRHRPRALRARRGRPASARGRAGRPRKDHHIAGLDR